jgi:GT2 family glycosyltransferase
VKPDVTVILNLYRRPEYLRAQVMALEHQTRPVQIMVWHNVD